MFGVGGSELTSASLYMNVGGKIFQKGRGPRRFTRMDCRCFGLMVERGNQL